MKVRLDFDIPAEEKAFLLKRKEVVSRALEKILNLKTPLDPTQVPTVALVCSGGGSRAMTGMYGSLKGLQTLGLLDTITYITSVSGSTWSTASLYSDPFWSKEGLETQINFAKKMLSKSTASLFSPAQLSYYHSELQNREKEGYSVSLIDTWGLIIENLIFGKKHTDTLSHQKNAVSEGQNPLPIYTAVNMKKDSIGSTVPEWCEFTPFEVGFSKYGTFFPAEYFGSEFYLGHVVKKLPETRISFLLGIWSSAFSINLAQIWSSITGVIPSWVGGNVDHIGLGCSQHSNSSKRCLIGLRSELYSKRSSTPTYANQIFMELALCRFLIGGKLGLSIEHYSQKAHPNLMISFSGKTICNIFLWIVAAGNESTTMDTLRVDSEDTALSEFLNNRPIISKVFNFLRGFFLHNLYRKSPNFNTSKETNPDMFPNKLTPMDSTLGLVDSGFANNTAFPPVLRPNRCANVILCLSYSWDEDQLKVIKDTQEYCIEHQLPFPKIDFSKYTSQPYKEVYVFEDEKNPDAPIVLHFPLVNVSFKTYKEPGVKRTGKKELNEGNINVSTKSSPYVTSHFTYSTEDFQRLVDLTSYNILNNKETIINTLKKALNKKGLPIIPSAEETSSCIVS
ncbi:hypothetical protein HF521_021813 [Silurus meridionalis]|uniref:PLA2c domain-containing protein n=1 Tax=Silurus meridionalis TaxID=175797 RepID=A0A8T0BCD5_SILME|nr:hypothetical protein HF521_021813 [Silurus meridionalis]